MDNSSLQLLLQKYVENKATPQEIRRLLDHFHTASEDRLMRLIMDGFANDHEDPKIDNIDRIVLNRVYNRLNNKLHFIPEIQKPAHIRKLLHFSAAAFIIFALSFGMYFFKYNSNASHFKNNIVKGHKQATLVLANGKKVILSKGLSGKVAQQKNVAIYVSKQSAIAYSKTGDGSNIPLLNTLYTTIGEQSPYPLILADGTKVWLDAESSITFPVSFTGKDRIVKITGEAYFEVFHNSAHPFKVMVKNHVIEDIGTSFNINSYDNEKAIVTTLLQGSVKVSVQLNSYKGRVLAFLAPGQQSIYRNNDLVVRNADTEESIAWKNGYFRFNKENILSIMQQLSRWYDIDVKYEGHIPDDLFYATSSRDRNISDILNMLQETKTVHFKIEGRRVTVMQ